MIQHFNLHDTYENMPKTPIPFLQPPPAVNWFQRKIYPNVDGNWENSSLPHMVLYTGLPWYAKKKKNKKTKKLLCKNTCRFKWWN